MSYTFLKKDSLNNIYSASEGILGIKYPTVSVISVRGNKRYVKATISLEDSSFKSLQPCVYSFGQSSLKNGSYFEGRKLGCFNSNNSIQIKLKCSEKVGFLIYPIIKNLEGAYIFELLEISPIYSKGQ